MGSTSEGEVVQISSCQSFVWTDSNEDGLQYTVFELGSCSSGSEYHEPVLCSLRAGDTNLHALCQMQNNVCTNSCSRILCCKSEAAALTTLAAELIRVARNSPPPNKPQHCEGIEEATLLAIEDMHTHTQGCIRSSRRSS